MSDEQKSLVQRIRRPLVLATVGAVFLVFVAWFGPQLRDDLWFMRFEEGCNRGEADACAGLGWRYLIGSGTVVDRKRGHALLDKACREDDIMWACAAVGNTHWWDEDAQFLLTNEQTERAKSMCREGTIEACDVVNSVGLDVPEPVAPEKSMERCLDDDPVACWATLDYLVRERGDDRTAVCELGFTHACPGALLEEDGEQFFRRLYWRRVRSAHEHRDQRHTVLDRWVAGAIDTDTVVAELTALCRIDGAACELAAKLRAKRGGVVELAQDWEFVRAFYKRACEGESRWGCWGLAQYRERMFWGSEIIQEKFPDYTPPLPSEAYQRACSLGYERSCDDVAEWLAEEKGDPSLYRKELEKLCRGRKVEACDALILDLRSGRSGPRDFERANTIQQAVCEAGSEDHCDHWLFGHRRP